MEKSRLVTRDYLSTFETREEGDLGIIEGRPVVLGERSDLGLFDEIIDRNALASTDMRDVRLCLNHDTSYVYARSRNNNENSTMQIGVDDMGMYFRAGLDVKNSPKAQDYYAAIQRRDIDKMSFMFFIGDENKNTRWEGLDTDHPTRIILAIERIVEISAVTFPAYDGTSISARYKESLENDRQALESAKAVLESAKRSLDSDLELAKAKALAKILF